MRKFLLLWLLILSLITIQPVSSEQDKPYLAVFCTTTGGFRDWIDFKPDLYFQSNTFTNLDFFLKVVKIKAEGRPIVLDIECHGGVDGFLSTDMNGSDICSFGYLVKNIDRNLHGEKLTVLLEACHASVVAAKSLKCPFNLIGNTYQLADFNSPIEFPIYGVGPSVNYDNLIYLQYYYNLRLFFKDLRGSKDLTADNSKSTDLSVRCLTCLLEKFKS